MNDSSDLPRLTWRVVGFSLLAAAVSLGAALYPILERQTVRASWPVGIIVLVAGFQVMNARRLFLHSHPAEVRSWMRPLGLSLYAIALLDFALLAWPLVQR